jgi:hypothetical protein
MRQEYSTTENKNKNKKFISNHDTPHRRTVPERRARKQCFRIGSTWGAITRGEPYVDAEGGRGDRGENGIGARGVVYLQVKSNMRLRLEGQ